MSNDVGHLRYSGITLTSRFPVMGKLSCIHFPSSSSSDRRLRIIDRLGIVIVLESYTGYDPRYCTMILTLRFLVAKPMS